MVKLVQALTTRHPKKYQILVVQYSVSACKHIFTQFCWKLYWEIDIPCIAFSLSKVFLLLISGWYVPWQILDLDPSICTQRGGQSFLWVDNFVADLCFQSQSVFWRHQFARQWRIDVYFEDCQHGLCSTVFLGNDLEVDCFWIMEILYLCLDLSRLRHCLCK